MRKIKRNDEVIVITGKDKGKRGDVLRVLDNGKAVVSGVNIIKKHTRPDPNRNIAGGIIEKEAPIQISNIAIWNAEEGRGDRVGFLVEDGEKRRVFKSTGKTIDT
ncbi:MAG: 50S ribosomal protein L24 [Gammaproteobacteria bacterium]|jgi:large subunit ribosomal protein L24|nr:MAG: 50S ribosomal protein L24 [Gammaproteobacteria bacterium]